MPSNPITQMDSDVKIEETINCTSCGKEIRTVSESDLDAEMEVKIVGKRGWYRREVVKPLSPMRNIVLCNGCADKRIAERDAVFKDEKKAQWEALCPPAYRDTEAHRLPMPSKLEVVMRWKYGPKGLTLIGATGKGKSRCAWKLLEREFSSGRSVECLDAKFAMQYSQKISISGAVTYEWLESKMNAGILLLDDVLKVRLDNTGCETALFAIIEERMANNLPIILTTQDTGETLKTRMSPDRGEAVVRRLRECCQTITF